MENNVWKCIYLNFCKIQTVDEVGVDEMGVDEMGVDKMGSRPSGNKPNTMQSDGLAHLSKVYSVIAGAWVPIVHCILNNST